MCRDLEAQARDGAIDDGRGRVSAIAAEFKLVRTALLAERAGRGGGAAG
jgi:hypothetical protein